MNRRAAALLALLALPGPGCGPRPELRLSGRTMGTTWRVTLVGRGSPVDLQEKIERRLEEVNQSLSTYREDSEICRFNRFRRVGEEFPISADFLRVMKVAARVFELSGGAWDGTVMPLVDLWGFGPAGPVGEPPGEEKIASSLAAGRLREDRDPGLGRARQARGVGDPRPRLDREGLRGRSGGRARPPRGLHGLHRRDRRRGPRRRDAAGRAALEGGHQPAASRRAPRRGLPGRVSCATRRSPPAATTATTSSGTASATRTSSTRGPAAP